MTSQVQPPSPTELEHIYARRIQPDLLDGVAASARPTAVLVGGQPGAGKAYASARVRQHLSGTIGPGVVISADALVAYHPHWHTRLPDLSGESVQVRADLGRWAERLAADGMYRRVNLIIESTMRQPQASLALAGRLAAGGYDVAAVILATERDDSRQASLARYDLGRAAGAPVSFVPAARHDSAYAGLRETLARIEAERAVSRLQLVVRDGRQLYANDVVEGRWRHEPRALAVLDDFRERRPTARELADSALRWTVLAQRLGRDATVPREVASQTVAWRHEALARAEADPQASRLLAWGREAECFRTMDRAQFLREFPQHAKAVERLEDAVRYAAEQFTLAGDRERFVAQARERLAERIAEGRFGMPKPPDVKDRDARTR